jgi:hypothetical protein
MVSETVPVSDKGIRTPFEIRQIPAPCQFKYLGVLQDGRGHLDLAALPRKGKTQPRAVGVFQQRLGCIDTSQGTYAMDAEKLLVPETVDRRQRYGPLRALARRRDVKLPDSRTYFPVAGVHEIQMIDGAFEKPEISTIG